MGRFWQQHVKLRAKRKSRALEEDVTVIESSIHDLQREEDRCKAIQKFGEGTVKDHRQDKDYEITVAELIKVARRRYYGIYKAGCV